MDSAFNFDFYLTWPEKDRWIDVVLKIRKKNYLPTERMGGGKDT